MTAPKTVTVLVVDDNPELLNVFIEGLPLAGDFTVLTASDGSKGLEAYYAHRPDIVVIDLIMPELNGYQMARSLRGDPISADVPLILFTALPQDHTEFASFAAGGDQFLTKPVIPRELAAAINQALLISDQERTQRLRRLAEEDDR